MSLCTIYLKRKKIIFSINLKLLHFVGLTITENIVYIGEMKNIKTEHKCEFKKK